MPSTFSLTIPAGPVDGLIFDCDGTIVDSMPLHWHAWRAALAAAGAPFEFTLAMHHRDAGMSIPEIVAKLNAEFSCALDASVVAAGREAYFFNHLHELEAVAPVVEIIRAWSGRVPMAVASGSARGIVERELEHLGLLGCFQAIVTAGEVPRSKPFPDMFLRAAELIGVPPAGCIVFEDGQNGLRAAEAAGMRAVYVPTND